MITQSDILVVADSILFELYDLLQLENEEMEITIFTLHKLRPFLQTAIRNAAQNGIHPNARTP